MTIFIVWLAAVAALVAPAGLFAAYTMRTPVLRQRAALLGGTGALGAALSGVVLAIEAALTRFVELDTSVASGGRALARLYAFAFAAPLELGAIVTTVAIMWRVRRGQVTAVWTHKQAKREGMGFAIAAALGFAFARNIATIAVSRATLELIRVVLVSVSLAALSAVFGYVLGRSPDRGTRGRRFALSWLGVTFFSAVESELVFHHGLLALLLASTLAGCAVLLSTYLWQEERLRGEPVSSPRTSLLMSAPAPSLAAIREAFKRKGRPLTLRAIVFGAFVNVGFMVACLAASIWLGHRAGVGFAVVDRSDAPEQAALPLFVLGVGALAAFPLSGYLLARALGTRSVLEPALSSALAMVLGLVFLGVVAPTAIVFVLALLPVAFGLSCSGAWFALAR